MWEGGGMVDTLTVYGWSATDLAWRQQAACIGYTDVFFPDRPNSEARLKAISICRTCPVVMECGDYANETAEISAVWGGVNRTPRFRL